jgi:hypothetical protein
VIFKSKLGITAVMTTWSSQQSQTVFVSLAQRYWRPEWSPARNREVYGASASLEGIGRNLCLTVSALPREANGLASDLDFSAPLAALKAYCDHRCLFTDFAEFRSRPSTTESLTLHLADYLFHRPPPEGASWRALSVREDDGFTCTAYPSEATLDIEFRVLNLTFTVRRPVDPVSGLSIARDIFWQAVRDVAPAFAEPARHGLEAWGGELFAALAARVEGLSQLAIDLGGHRTLIMGPQSSGQGPGDSYAEP